MADARHRTPTPTPPRSRTPTPTHPLNVAAIVQR